MSQWDPLYHQIHPFDFFEIFIYSNYIRTFTRTRIFWAFNGMREGPGAGNRVLAPTLQLPNFLFCSVVFCAAVYLVLLRFCSIRELFSTECGDLPTVAYHQLRVSAYSEMDGPPRWRGEPDWTSTIPPLFPFPSLSREGGWVLIGWKFSGTMR